MTELETAIYTHYNNNAPLKAQLTGGLHNTEVEQGSVMPFGVFQIISDVPRLTFTEDQEEVLIQFKLFSKKKSSIELNNMFAALKKVYDFTTLTITDYISISCKRVNSKKTKIEDVWQYTVLYMILFEKNVSVRR